MAHYKMLDGNGAAVEAIRMAKVKVVSAYPITLRAPLRKKLSELCDSGELDAKYIRVESEHTAMSCALGAQLTGIRCATATASVGLALMHEVLNVVSGCRVPIVMPVVTVLWLHPGVFGATTRIPWLRGTADGFSCTARMFRTYTIL